LIPDTYKVRIEANGFKALDISLYTDIRRHGLASGCHDAGRGRDAVGRSH